MILHTPGNQLYPDENNTFLDWQTENISGVGLKPNAQPQRVAGLDLLYRLVCHPDIQ